ncbi:MBL fold metallo-hydrolase [Oscillatoria sp. CS-180]|uniref:MBL fold metallo-hydrolase n=1 Tax=Oscillatoria sp. CS-180 TaxID=3021720 RepID=UPI0023301093|nr:MBL fold metallo-hydrolase [Oscillatoria sp. CS-180]MDB9524588.1 MBL fold metallo-hydrolase [Oscillatoria sp. CS-180]
MPQTVSFTKTSQLQAFTLCDYNSMAMQPFIQDILDRFVESDNLETALLDAAKNHAQIARVLFDIDPQNPVESFSLKEPYLFPTQNSALSLSYINPKINQLLNNGGSQVIRDPAIWADVHRVLHLCGRGDLSYRAICEQSSDRMVKFLDSLIKAWVVREDDPPQRVELPPEPGVMRLQHAALLFRSQTTGLLVDPQLHSNYSIPGLKQDISRAMLEGYVDGILISHNHYDHWHLPTLMQFAPDIPIIVPKVPRASITCDDMATRLQELGFERVIAVDWYAEPISIGDMKVHVLPFYGEQPLVPRYDIPRHPDLRNWGNTYLIETADYTAWFLIDAGTDPMGSMREVAQRIGQTFGSIDMVLSNFQPLSFNSIGTDLSDWGLDILGTMLSNPQIFATIGKEEGAYLSTLGPTGVAEICQIVAARACLPYAHSWAELGHPTEQDESLLQATQAELTRRGCNTQLIPWCIGDGYFCTAAREAASLACRPAFY